MGSICSLKKNSDFQKVYNEGRSLADKTLVMYILPSADGQANRIGISVSKKIGNSVIRHRVKRLVRESFRLNADRLAKGFDIVVIARKNACGRGYREIESSFLKLCGLHNLIIEQEKSVD